MKPAALAALLAAALALPAASQTPPSGEKPRAAPAAETRQKADGTVAPRERARAAKAQNRELKCATKSKQQKKAAAT